MAATLLHLINKRKIHENSDANSKPQSMWLFLSQIVQSGPVQLDFLANFFFQ